MLSLSDTTDRIERTLDKLQEATEEYSKRLRDSTEAEANWKLARAKTLLESKNDPSLKSVDMREAYVLQQNETVYQFFLLEQAKCEAQKQRILTIRSYLSAVQSLQRVITV